MLNFLLPIAAESGGLASVVSPKPGSVLWTIITFLVIVWLVSKFGWKPILSGLKSREDSIRKDLETAKAEREKASALLADYQASMANAKKEAAEVIQRAQDAANQHLELERIRAKETADRLIDRANAEIERERDAARADLRQYVADLTARATSRLVGKTVDAKDHERFILDALKEDR
ncbi:F0F1 ATP synthase subunit B [candidate division KSB1 bacterium]|nr:F0F1 ATP synthase subunit B [candidate division KSB1 bacterium]